MIKQRAGPIVNLWGQMRASISTLRGETNQILRKNESNQYQKVKQEETIKEWTTSSPFDGYKLSRLVASSHQHTAIGAITQLLQGGVAIHHFSKHSFMSFLIVFLCKLGCRNTRPIHWSNILLLLRPLTWSVVPSLFHQPEFTSSFPKENSVSLLVFVFVSQSREFKAHLAATGPCKKAGSWSCS